MQSGGEEGVSAPPDSLIAHRLTSPNVSTTIDTDKISFERSVLYAASVSIAHECCWNFVLHTEEPRFMVDKSSLYLAILHFYVVATKICE